MNGARDGLPACARGARNEGRKIPIGKYLGEILASFRAHGPSAESFFAESFAFTRVWVADVQSPLPFPTAVCMCRALHSIAVTMHSSTRCNTRSAFQPVAATAALLLLATHHCASAQPHSIETYGAVAGVDTHAQALINGQAFWSAVAAANTSSIASRRSVLVPAAKVYAFLPASPWLDGVRNVTIYLEGTLNVSTANFSAGGGGGYPGWPSPYPALPFRRCADLAIVSNTGGGLVNGRGSVWWWYTILVGDHRSNLLEVDGCERFALRGVAFLNAPQYHVNLHDHVNSSVSGVTIMVDLDDQLDVYRYVGGYAGGRGERVVDGGKGSGDAAENAEEAGTRSSSRASAVGSTSRLLGNAASSFSSSALPEGESATDEPSREAAAAAAAGASAALSAVRARDVSETAAVLRAARVIGPVTDAQALGWAERGGDVFR